MPENILDAADRFNFKYLVSKLKHKLKPSKITCDNEKVCREVVDSIDLPYSMIELKPAKVKHCPYCGSKNIDKEICDVCSSQRAEYRCEKCSKKLCYDCTDDDGSADNYCQECVVKVNQMSEENNLKTVSLTAKQRWILGHLVNQRIFEYTKEGKTVDESIELLEKLKGLENKGCNTCCHNGTMSDCFPCLNCQVNGLHHGLKDNWEPVIKTTD